MYISNQELQSFTTFSILAKADYWSVFTSEPELIELLKHNPSSKLLILGGGSNILLSGDFKGLVLKNEIKGIRVISETEDSYLVEVGAGENWHEFVLHAIEKNWYGIENLSLIPGSVGASPIQNIGAYGVEVKDVIESVEALNVHNYSKKIFKNSDCQFSYRNSIFKNSEKGNYVITKVVFKLNKVFVPQINYGDVQKTIESMNTPLLSAKTLSDAICIIRKSKLPDPTLIGNAGSFFKNPEINIAQFEIIVSKFPLLPFYKTSVGYKIPAGWLIEQCGWKGKRIDDYGVHVNQALVLVNYGNAKGSDIWALALTIQNSVLEKFGILIENEVNYI